jgi:hypothetical protein
VTYFVKYDLATGEPRGMGNCPPSEVANQAVEGEGVIAVDRNPEVPIDINGQVAFVVDINAVRATMLAKVDAEAEGVRSLFITPGSGQAMTYWALQAEAAAYLAGSTEATLFLDAEAEATGITKAELASVVAANAAQWAVIGSKINAARRKAKKTIAEDTNIAAIHAASKIDWNSVIS